MNIFEKALNFATSKEILADNSWSVEHMKNLLCLENYNQFQENGKESIFFYGSVDWDGKIIPIRGDMYRFIPGMRSSKEVGFFITFDDRIPGINLYWLYENSHLSFKKLETDHYPFISIPVSNFILEEYSVEVMIDVNRDKSVTGFRATFIEEV